MKDILVIDIPYSGLGDHLFYTPIPRIAKENGIKKVYLSENTNYRQIEIKKLLWDTNPYLDGVATVAPTAFSVVEKDGNLLDKLLAGYGLSDRKNDHEPEVYCQIKINEDLAEHVVYDPNYVSFIGSVSKKKLNVYIEKLKPTLQLEFRGKGHPIPNVPVIKSNSLEEYIEIIASCRKFICFTSGGATLASAIRKDSVAFYGSCQDPIFRHSKNVNYIDVGDYSGLGLINGLREKIANSLKQKIMTNWRP